MSPANAPILDRICAAVMLALAAMVLLDEVGGQGWAAAPSRGLALALALVMIPRFGLREWLLMGLAVALSAGLWLRPDGAGDLAEALGKGAYFTAFILLMMLLREAALTSDAVLTVGRWVTLQPPGRRFAATWLSGHVAGILMNFGAVSLLSPLIQRGVHAIPVDTEEDARRAEIRERRQLSALIRGFAWVFTWAPTTLTQAIILAAVPGLAPARALTLGLGLSALMFLVGWAEDRLRWGPPRQRPDLAGPFPVTAGLQLLPVYVLLVAGALVVQARLDIALPQALISVAPLMLIGWVTTQNLGRPRALGQTAGRLAEVVSTAIPRAAKDAFLLGLAGFIGIAAARLAPVEVIAGWSEAAGLPPWALVASLPVLITLGGQVALSPMMMVVFLAAVVSALPVLPAPPEFIAAALAAGWALSMTASPNATGALLLAGATGHSSVTLTWRWNGAYSLIVIGVLIGVFWVLVG